MLAMVLQTVFVTIDGLFAKILQDVGGWNEQDVESRRSIFKSNWLVDRKAK